MGHCPHKANNFTFAAPTLEVLLSPKDTQIKEYGSQFLVCIFRSSSKVKVLWEKEGDLLPNELQRRASTSQYKSNMFFIVSFRHNLNGLIFSLNPLCCLYSDI